MRNRPWSLRQFQEMFNLVYGDRNQEMYTPAELLLHIFEETAEIAESLRKEDHNNVPTAIAHFFGWLVAFCNSQKIDLGGAIFAKYHGACPYCGKVKNCICISAETKPGAWHKNKSARVPDSLSGWQVMFDQIYGRVNRVAGREKSWLHVHEELGELSRAFRLGQKRFLKDELADVFAWLIAFCNHLKINLDAVVYAAYPGKCDVCGKKQCKCPKV
ncbi:hypothetical protein KKC00_03080 [Patescibacteria group bacterium]|nr:hypothetical protein [Patescibacteria group bacterium]